MIKYSFLDIEIKGKEIQRFFNLCVFHGIILKNIQEMDEGKFYCQIEGRDFFVLQTIVRKTGVKIKILKKNGYYFSLKKLISYKVFLIFLCFTIAVIVYTSRLLWTIDIEGNINISSYLLKQSIFEENISPGMFIDRINTEELEKKLRKEFDEITWISVSISGTTLQVNLKENDTDNGIQKNVLTGNIVADKEGIVESIFVRQGTKNVSVGDPVSQGTVLIRGIQEIPDGTGTKIKEVPVAAKGDVSISYRIPIRERLLLEYNTKVYSGNEIKKYDLVTEKNIYHLNDDTIPFLEYDYYEEEITPLLVKLLFPDIKIIRKNYRDYLEYKEKYEQEEAQEIVSNNFKKILKSLEEKGVQIIEKNVKMKIDDVSVSLEGDLKVREVFKEKDYRNE